MPKVFFGIVILVSGLLFATSGFASGYEKILCVGGYTTPWMTYTVELGPELDLPALYLD